MQRSETLPALPMGDIAAQRAPTETTSSVAARSAIPSALAGRVRSNSTSVLGSAGLRAPPPAPLKRTWDDLGARSTLQSEPSASGTNARDPSTADAEPLSQPSLYSEDEAKVSGRALQVFICF